MPIEITVTFRHVEPSDALRRYAESKVQRLGKFARRFVEAHVVLSVIKRRHVAEVTMTGSRTSLKAAEETSDLYSAIDLATDKLERQIKRQSEKRQDRKHLAPQEEAPAARRARAPRVERERVAVKPMSLEEAVAEIVATKRQFLVFRNDDSDTLNVLYRRKSGGFGVIEPEGD